MLRARHQFGWCGSLCQSHHPDVWLSAAEEEVKPRPRPPLPAHRVILAAVSDKLAALCSQGGVVTVRNVRYDLLDKAIAFIYTGEVMLNSQEDQEDLEDVLDMLKINLETETTSSSAVSVKNDAGADSLNNFVKPNIEKTLDIEKCEKEIKDELEEIDEIQDSSEKALCKRQHKRKVESTDWVNGYDDQSESAEVDGEEDVSGKASRKRKLSYVIQCRELACQFCGESMLYRQYVKHCRLAHPTSPWAEKRRCGTCKERIMNIYDET